MDVCIFFCEIQGHFLILDPGTLLHRGSCLPLSRTPYHSARPETLTFGGATVRGTRTPHGPGGAARPGQLGSWVLCMQLGQLQRFCSYFMRLSRKQKKGDAGISEDSMHVQASCKMGTKMEFTRHAQSSKSRYPWLHGGFKRICSIVKKEQNDDMETACRRTG